MAVKKLADDTQSDDVMDELQAGTSLLHGQYTITRFLNNGGFGITYLAKDSLDRDIVIKECFPGAFCRRTKTIVSARSRAHQNELKSIIRLFVQEARSMSKLVHPHIVGVHQVFEDNDTAYMAIDYVDGKDLLAMLDDGDAKLTPSVVVDMTRKLLDAVKFVHDHGMLHRDISPDNILLDQDGEPILIDFGAAREHVPESAKALSALRVVKDGYSPQEFYIAGSEQGPWSDLYALAASLFHVITGEAPVNGQARLSALAEQREDPYTPLAGRIEGYPAGFLEAIDKAMQPIPKNRLQTAEEWLNMLDAPAGPGRVDGNVEAAVMSMLQDSSTPSADGPDDTATDSVSLENLDAGRSAEIFGELPALDDRSSHRSRILAGSVLAFAAMLGVVGYNMISSDTADTTAPINTTQEADTTALIPIVPAIDVPASENAAVDATNEVAASDPDVAGAVATDALAEVEAAALIAAEDAAKAEAVAAAEAEAAALAEAEAAAAAEAEAAALAEAEAAAAAEAEAAALAEAEAAAAAEAEAAALAEAEAAAASATKTLVEQQVQYALWDVRIPFEFSQNTVRNSEIALITELSGDLVASVSGDWIAVGTEIFTINGAPLEKGVAFETQLLNAMSVDPDGYTRATVRFKDALTGRFDRGLLAVPVVRKLALADGSLVEIQMIEKLWTAKITEVPASIDNGLKAGDVLIEETSKGVVFSTPDALETSLATLVKDQTGIAEFSVLRDGNKITVPYPLTVE
ncbi:MAG: serine/threonine-protein kinase [Albidovulum sp.]